jgi:hypothetical protein
MWKRSFIALIVSYINYILDKYNIKKIKLKIVLILNIDF